MKKNVQVPRTARRQKLTFFIPLNADDFCRLVLAVLSQQAARAIPTREEGMLKEQSIEMFWMEEEEEQAQETSKVPIDESPSEETSDDPSPSDICDQKTSIITECEEFLRNLNRQRLGMRPPSKRQHSAARHRKSLCRKESANSLSATAEPEEQVQDITDEQQHQPQLPTSLKGEAKYSSTREDRLSLKSLVQTSWRLSKNRGSTKCSDDSQSTAEDAIRPKKGLSKLTGSLSRVVCAAGVLKEASREKESRYDNDQVRYTCSDENERVSVENGKDTKKVAFLSDLVDLTGEPVVRPRLDTIDSECSQESQETNDHDTEHDTELVLHSYEDFVETMYQKQAERMGESDLSRRMKTSLLALVEDIDDDAGLWLGLRRDSFEVPLEFRE